MIYCAFILQAEEGTSGVLGKQHLSQLLESELCFCQLTIFHVNVRIKYLSDASNYH